MLVEIQCILTRSKEVWNASSVPIFYNVLISSDVRCCPPAADNEIDHKVLLRLSYLPNTFKELQLKLESIF